ncbi:MAG: hypothetical protein IPJ88_13870 [Myxococcales bacterium]|nr:MAG: hypothetical protein IPJ88_13870 [Myxococcales bacterium]
MLERFYGSDLLMRPPAPVTMNKAGANYKSEVMHTSYSPRQAYREWLTICDAIVECGGDSIFMFEEADQRFWDREVLRVLSNGTVIDSDTKEELASVDEILTGRVFTANGPWVQVQDKTLRVLYPRMLEHRQREIPYYQSLLEAIAAESGFSLLCEQNPHPWEGLADVVVVDDTVFFTHTVRGHYDAGIAEKTLRSSLEGVQYVAEFFDLDPAKTVFLELIYPHFHGDTAYFALRAEDRSTVAVYEKGFYADGGEVIWRILDGRPCLKLSKQDAVDAYAGNSRQVNGGVLVPTGVSMAYENDLKALGLKVFEIELQELFAKAGGGPGCATLYLPTDFPLPKDSPLRYSNVKIQAQAHANRIPDRVEVDAAYFSGKSRG